jgi:hypothetical protein
MGYLDAVKSKLRSKLPIFLARANYLQGNLPQQDNGQFFDLEAASVAVLSG